MPRVQRAPAGRRVPSYSPRAADPPIDDDNDTSFTEQFIKPQLVQPNETMESYTLEAKPTRATFAETFSHEDEEYDPNYVGVHHRFTDDDHNNHNESFLNIAEEAAHIESYHPQRTVLAQGTFDSQEPYHVNDDSTRSGSGRDDYLSGIHGDSTYSSGGEGDFIDLAQEAAAIPSRHCRSSVHMRHDEFEEYAENYGMEEDDDGTMLQFVDSEDGQAFSFRTKRTKDDQRLSTTLTYENNSSHHYRTTDSLSLEDTSVGYESKTLNTNLETLHTDLEGVNYIPTINEHDVMHDPAYHVHEDYQQAAMDYGAEGESYDDDEERLNGGYNGAGVAIPQTASYQYEDDGYIRQHRDEYDDDHHTGFDEDTYTDNLRKQDTFQETVNTYQDTVTEYTRDVDTGAGETQDGEYTEILSQLQDSYLSDRSSVDSWDEDSLAGETRNSFDGTEFTGYTEDDRANGAFIGVLKSIRDYGRGGEFSDEEDSGMEFVDDVDDGKKRRKNRRRSRRKSRKGGEFNAVLGRISEIGMDLLNETIEQAEKSTKNSRRRRSRRDDHTGGLIDSFSNLFSCGAPSRY